MKLDHTRLVATHERLKKELGRKNPALKTLCKVDTTGQFEALKKIMGGLKIRAALPALKAGRFCKCCKVQLCKASVCGECASTPKGKRLTAEGKSSKISSRLQARSSEQVKSASKKRARTNLKVYGTANPSGNAEVKKKKAATTQKHYGVDHPWQAKEIRQQIENTCLARYGVKHALQSTQVRNKGKKTLLKKTGYDHNMKDPKVRAKVQATWDKKYSGHPMRDAKVKAAYRRRYKAQHGVDSPMANPEVQAERRRLQQERYGVDHPLQRREVLHKQQKAMHRLKHVKVQGKWVWLQGYEPQVARQMVKVIDNAQFKESTRKPLPYNFEDDRSYYHIDFEIKSPKDHYLVEVKSPFTLEAEWKKNLAKFRAANKYAEKRGCKFVLAIHHPRVGTVAMKSPNRLSIKRTLLRFT